MQALRARTPAASHDAGEPSPRAEVRARIAELRCELAARGRLVIDDLLPRDVTLAIAEDVRALPFVRVSNGPGRRGSREQPPFDNFFHVVEVDPLRAASPLRAFVRSVAAGALRDFFADLTGRPGLHNRQGKKHRPVMVAHRYERGCFLGAHDDRAIDQGARRSIAMVLHLSQPHGGSWEPSWGGALRFVGPPEELYFPRFGALHVFDVLRNNRHEVTPLVGPELRFSLTGWLYELP